MTVITDPQGATFVASKFVLENKDLGSPADAAGCLRTLEASSIII